MTKEQIWNEAFEAGEHNEAGRETKEQFGMNAYWLRSDAKKAADEISANLARLELLIPGTVVELVTGETIKIIGTAPVAGLMFVVHAPNKAPLWLDPEALFLVRAAIEKGAKVTLPRTVEDSARELAESIAARVPSPVSTEEAQVEAGS